MRSSTAFLACPEGLEPPTCCLEGSCPIQLSYGQTAFPAGAGQSLRILRGGSPRKLLHVDAGSQALWSAADLSSIAPQQLTQENSGEERMKHVASSAGACACARA